MIRTISCVWQFYNNINKTQLHATVGSLIYFTAKSLYMFRVPTAPIIKNTKNYPQLPVQVIMHGTMSLKFNFITLCILCKILGINYLIRNKIKVPRQGIIFTPPPSPQMKIPS